MWSWQHIRQVCHLPREPNELVDDKDEAMSFEHPATIAEQTEEGTMLSKPQRSFKRNRGSPKLPTSFRSPDRSRRSAEALDSFQFIP